MYNQDDIQRLTEELGEYDGKDLERDYEEVLLDAEMSPDMSEFESYDTEAGEEYVDDRKALAFDVHDLLESRFEQALASNSLDIRALDTLSSAKGIAREMAADVYNQLREKRKLDDEDVQQAVARTTSAYFEEVKLLNIDYAASATEQLNEYARVDDDSGGLGDLDLWPDMEESDDIL